MKSIVALGVGAGLASALLIAVIAKATPLAFVLYMLAPLPIVIVSLGWHHRAGLVAGAAGAVALALFSTPLRGLAFVVSTALPAWWLAYLALLGRPDADGSRPAEWYPLGRLLAWVAVTSAASLTAIAILSSGSAEAFREKTRQIVEALVRFRDTGVPDDAEFASRVVDGLALLVPGLAAQGFAFLLVLYLWAAARIVRISGRLPRPWPDLPGAQMPRPMLLALLAGGLAAAFGGFVGVFGAALVGALVTAFALQGLAAIHDRTRGRPGRGVMLSGLYLVVFLTQGAALLALTLFGLVDAAFQLRRKPAAGPA